MIFAENPLGWLWVQQKILWGALGAQRKIFGALLGRKSGILWGAKHYLWGPTPAPRCLPQKKNAALIGLFCIQIFRAGHT